VRGSPPAQHAIGKVAGAGSNGCLEGTKECSSPEHHGPSDRATGGRTSRKLGETPLPVAPLLGRGLPSASELLCRFLLCMRAHCFLTPDAT